MLKQFYAILVMLCFSYGAISDVTTKTEVIGATLSISDSEEYRQFQKEMYKKCRTPDTPSSKWKFCEMRMRAEYAKTQAKSGATGTTYRVKKESFSCNSSSLSASQREACLKLSPKQAVQERSKPKQLSSCPFDEEEKCTRYSFIVGSCSMDDSKSMASCRNIAEYKVGATQAEKDECPSSNIESCIFYRNEFKRCMSKVSDAGTCKKASQAFTVEKDKLLKMFGEEYAVEVDSTFQMCLMKGTKTLSQCIQSVKDEINAILAESKRCDLEGKKSGYCGDDLYIRQDNTANELVRAAKDAFGEMEKSFNDFGKDTSASGVIDDN